MCFGSAVAMKYACERVVSVVDGGGKLSMCSSSSSCVCWYLCSVLFVFLHWVSRWLMAVASWLGGYLCKVVAVRPVNGGRKPFFRAVVNIEMVGENSAVWANVTKSAGVLVCRLIAEAANCVGSSGSL